MICPRCRTVNTDDSMHCKKCGFYIGGDEKTPVPSLETPWYHNELAIVFFLIVVFPVGLYLMWTTNVWTPKTRTIITVICFFFGIGLIGRISEKINNPTPQSPVTATPVSSGAPVQAPAKPVPPYDIAAVQDISIGNAVRLEYRIKVNGPMTKDDLTLISGEIIKLQRPVNASVFFFYLPHSDINGAYTAGKAEWAPYGNWSEAMNVRTGDYSKHQLSVQAGSILGPVPKEVIVDLPIEKKKKIYRDAVKLEDKGMDLEQSYKALAKRYRLDPKTVEKVVLEGATSGWPLPP